MKKYLTRPVFFLGFIFIAIISFIVLQKPKNTYEVKRGDISSFLSASGKLDADKKAELSFKTTGRVSEVSVNEGDNVEKGQSLVKLDVKELALSLSRAQDDLRQAQAELENIYDQIKGHKNDESYTQIQSRTQAEVKRDKAAKNVESARKAFSDASLYAPFDGVVISKNIEVNEWVSAFSLNPQIVLVDPSTIYFSADADEEYIENLKVGQKATVTFDAYPGRSFDGEIYQIAKSVSETEGGDIIKVKIKLDETPDKSIIGLNGDSQILLEEKKEVLLVPKDAVYKRNGESFVKTASGERKIKLGIFDGSNWEVEEGLQDGEKIRW